MQIAILSKRTRSVFLFNLNYNSFVLLNCMFIKSIAILLIILPIFLILQIEYHN